MTEQPTRPLSQTALLSGFGAIVIASSAALLVARFPAVIPDDAFITFRYARNLAEGNGFVFNPGERILGTTTPVWTLALAGVLRLWQGADLPVLARVLSVCFYAAVGALIFDLTRRWIESRVTGPLMVALPALASASWLLSPPAIDAASTGMETTLFTFLLVLSAYLSDRRKDFLSGSVLGLAVLTRIDGVIAVGCLLLWSLVFARRSLGPALVGLLATSLPGLAAEALYFGSFVPNTVLAKSVLYANSEWEWTRGQVLLALLGRRLGALLWGMSLISLVFQFRSRWPGWLTMYPLVHAVFLIGFVARPQSWYLVAFWPGVIVTATLGIATIMSLPGGDGQPRTWRLWPGPSLDRQSWGIFAGYGLIAVIVLGLAIRTVNTGTLAFGQYETARTWAGGLHRIGDYLSQYPKDRTVFIGDIGIVGWRSGLQVYDFAGLVSPQAIPWNKERKSYAGRLNITGESVLAQIELVHPDFVVLARYMPFLEEVTQSSRFLACYRMAMESDGHLLFERHCL